MGEIGKSRKLWSFFLRYLVDKSSPNELIDTRNLQNPEEEFFWHGFFFFKNRCKLSFDIYDKIIDEYYEALTEVEGIIKG